MAKYVIDTNIPIVANGNDNTISVSCRLKAVELLTKVVETGIIYLDSDGAIQNEYKNHLQAQGQPGVGDRFYLEVLNSNPNRVQRIDLAKGDNGEYVDVPQPIIDAGFDPSDRVFVAVAKRSRAKVYNAVDSDWLEHRQVIEANGIPIVFICGCISERWRTQCG